MKSSTCNKHSSYIEDKVSDNIVKKNVVKRNNISLVTPKQPEVEMKQKRKKLMKGTGAKTLGLKQINKNKSGDISWKELKENKKARKQTRKQKKISGFHLTTQVKKLYETIKRRKFPKKEREEIVSRIYGLLKGHLKEVVYKHDMTRVAQLLVKVSSDSNKYAVWSELKPELLKMLLSKYASHTVISLLQFGGLSVRKEIVCLLKGHLLHLLKNKVASAVIDQMYKMYSVPEDKIWMRHELSGFRDDRTVSKLLETVERQGCFGFDSSKSLLIQSLVDCVKQEEERSIMITSKVTLQMLIEKNLAANALVQSVLIDYLMKCSPTDREELMSNLQPILQRILSEGLDSFYAVMLCVEYVWYGSSKERKWLIKQLHSHMPAVCLRNYSYFLIMVVLECVDDTVFLKKTLLKDITNNVRQITDNNYGWKIFMHLLSPRNPRHFSSAYVSLLKLGDTTAVKKKADDVRQAEILEPIVNLLLEDIMLDPSYWLSNGHRAILCCEAICKGRGTRLEDVFRSVTKFICLDKPGLLSEENSQANSRLKWVVKELIKTDSLRFKDGEATFSSFFMTHLTADDVKMWIREEAGTFLFVKMIGTGIPSIQKTVKNLFTSDIKTLIESGPSGDMLRSLLKNLKC